MKEGALRGSASCRRGRSHRRDLAGRPRESAGRPTAEPRNASRLRGAPRFRVGRPVDACRRRPDRREERRREEAIAVAPARFERSRELDSLAAPGIRWLEAELSAFRGREHHGACAAPPGEALGELVVALRPGARHVPNGTRRRAGGRGPGSSRAHSRCRSSRWLQSLRSTDPPRLPGRPRSRRSQRPSSRPRAAVRAPRTGYRAVVSSFREAGALSSRRAI